MRAGLQKRASFLKGEQPPPVGALARAAASMKARSEAKLILAHLDDPATPTAELPGLFEGLKQLGGKPHADRIDAFLHLYRADDDPGMIRALGAAAEALAALQRDAAKPTLRFVSNDPLTPEPLRDRTRKAMAEIDAPPPPPPEADKPVEPTEKVESEPTPDEKPEEKGDDRPEKITAGMARDAMSKVEEEIRGCLPRHIPYVSIVVVVAPSGRIKKVDVTPAALKACIAPLVRKQSFPSTKSEKGQQAVWVVHRQKK